MVSSIAFLFSDKQGIKEGGYKLILQHLFVSLGDYCPKTEFLSKKQQYADYKGVGYR